MKKVEVEDYEKLFRQFGTASYILRNRLCFSKLKIAKLMDVSHNTLDKYECDGKVSLRTLYAALTLPYTSDLFTPDDVEDFVSTVIRLLSKRRESAVGCDHYFNGQIDEKLERTLRIICDNFGYKLVKKTQC